MICRSSSPPTRPLARRSAQAVALSVLLLVLVAACGTPEEIAARTQSSLINGRGAGNIGTLDGRHLPSPGGGD